MDRILRMLSRVTALLFKLGPLKNGCDGPEVVFLEARARRIIGAPDAQERALFAHRLPCHLIII